jgi:hypothetical protein
VESLPTHVAHYVTASRTEGILTGLICRNFKEHDSPPSLILGKASCGITKIFTAKCHYNTQCMTEYSEPASREPIILGKTEGESLLWNLPARLRNASTVPEV